jgi:uncharacterized NAD(P)/FAD-binding protein YdhS
MARSPNAAGSTIAVVGAGFSGTLLALHLLRRCATSTRVLLIERNSRFGRGQAYASGNPGHLLNVPAGRMSAFHDRPSDFLDWLDNDPDAVRAAPDLAGRCDAGAFVPRRLYGAYIRSLLKQEIRRAPRRRLELIRGDVLALDRSGHPLRLLLDRDRTVPADVVVLAVGNFPPEPMPVADPSFYDTDFYRPDPWAPETLAGLDPDAPVLLIGTGLTMVDMVISLLDARHRGRITALSRRGLLPRRHCPAPPAAAPERHEFPVGINDLFAYLRRESAAALAQGGTWQAIIDELRPFTQDVWQMMSPSDRRRFLRHVRPWWDVHRHRLPPHVAERIEAARAAGRLVIRAGHIQGYRIDGDRVEVSYRPRRESELATLRVARVVNCTGLGADYDRIGHPLVRSMLAEGTARPDPLRLGLDVTNTGALMHRQGSISRRIFAVGPVTKGAHWEIVAVPDIRRQCEVLAQHLATLDHAPAADAGPRAPDFAI